MLSLKCKQLFFYFQGKTLTQDAEAGIIVTSNDLVLRDIKKNQSGLYACKATNSIGTGISSPINISVLCK